MTDRLRKTGYSVDEVIERHKGTPSSENGENARLLAVTSRGSARGRSGSSRSAGGRGGRSKHRDFGAALGAAAAAVRAGHPPQPVRHLERRLRRLTGAAV